MSPLGPVELRGYQGAVFGAAFDPDGRRVASAGDDGTVRVWACEVCGSIEQVVASVDERVTRELTCEERRTFLNNLGNARDASAVERHVSSPAYLRGSTGVE